MFFLHLLQVFNHLISHLRGLLCDGVNDLNFSQWTFMLRSSFKKNCRHAFVDVYNCIHNVFIIHVCFIFASSYWQSLEATFSMSLAKVADVLQGPNDVTWNCHSPQTFLAHSCSKVELEVVQRLFYLFVYNLVELSLRSGVWLKIITVWLKAWQYNYTFVWVSLRGPTMQPLLHHAGQILVMYSTNQRKF